MDLLRCLMGQLTRNKCINQRTTVNSQLSFVAAGRRKAGRSSTRLVIQSKGFFGEMSEWFKEHAWKACVGVTPPWVRIPLSPLADFADSKICSETSESVPRSTSRNLWDGPGRLRASVVTLLP